MIDMDLQKISFVAILLAVISIAAYMPFIEDQKTAFNEVSVAELTPIVQLQSSYNINTRIIEIRDNNGTASISNSKFRLSTGAGANQSSSFLSRISIKYNPGQGGLCRFTSLFTTGVANSVQYAGIGTNSNGYFFGYSGATFGILIRSGGSPEVRTLTVTTGSSDVENITITLDGDADASVAVTNTADVTLTANEIAAHDYSHLGQGWVTHVMGSTVTFESYNAVSQTGTYSLSSATSAVGTFAQTIAGAAPTESFTASSSWSEDQADGTGNLPVIDFTKGNVFEIRYQWLGFGAVDFFIERPSTGRFILVHRDEYANANTVPSVANPIMPLCLIAANTSNTSDIILESACMMGGIEGKNIEQGIANASVVETTGIGTTETPILSIHNHTVFQNKINRIIIKPNQLGVSFDASAANKPATVRVRLNAALTGASFSPIDVNTSVTFTDVSATSVSGGELLFALSISEGAPLSFDLSDRNVIIGPGETITISLEASSGTIDPVVSFGWREIF